MFLQNLNQDGGMDGKKKKKIYLPRDSLMYSM